MKKLTVLLATCFFFFTGDAQQILAGIYSGSMYNDSTKMLQKYELALSEYRGKVFGYSYVTFIVNDTFYYGIRRVKGHKTKGGELVLEDEELLANNFPESPAKRVRRTATFTLAQEDTITALTGSWQTNRTRQYYSVGGATKTERTLDSSQSALVAHLQELKIITGKPSYQDAPVVKNKPKENKKPKDTDVARRNDNKETDKAIKAVAASAKPNTGTAPANKPAAGSDRDAVATAGRPQAAGNHTSGQPGNRANTAPGNKTTGNTSAHTDAAVAAGTPNNTTKPGNNPVAAGPGAVTAPAATGTDRSANPQAREDKNAAAAGKSKPENAGNNTSATNAGSTVAATTGASGSATQPGQEGKGATGDNAVAGNSSTKKDGVAAGADGKTAAGTAGKDTGATTAASVKTAGNPAAGQPASGNTGVAAATRPGQQGNNPTADSAAGSATNTAAVKKGEEAGQADANKEAASASGGNTQGAATVRPEGDKAAGVTAGTGDDATGKTADAARKSGSERRRDRRNAGEVTEPAVPVTPPHVRSSKVIKTLEVVNDSITLSFYDNGVVDGDVISVFVNGENVLAQKRLNEVAMKKTIHLTTFAGDSVEVTLVAETLGSIPPNTGLLLVHDGDKRYDVRFAADMQTNATIVFRKGKK